MRVIVAEKPSMARALAQALGLRGAASEGSLATSDGGIVVTWCLGHLVELAPPEAYDARFKQWRLDDLPIVPDVFRLQVAARTTRQYRHVAALLRRRDLTDVVNACDAGREGELIFDLVYRHAGCRAPVLRFWTASLTDDALRAAYAAMKPAGAYTGLRDAARARQEADWLVGMNATRAQTLVARRGGGGRRGDVYSVGRVQTPTLALLVRRDEEIRTFVAKMFWTVEATFRIRSAGYDGTWCRADTAARPGAAPTVERLDSEAAARALVARLIGQPARVTVVEEHERRTPPELLYDLTTLQREANRRFGFSAKKTLGLAQALYEEHKVLSYPRTASRHLTRDVAATVPALLRQVARQTPYAAAVAPLVAAGPPPLGRRHVDDAKVEDHHALLPTGRAPGALTADEVRLYDLVVRRLIAAHYPPRVELLTEVVTVVAREPFRSRGAVEPDAGWAAVDPPHREPPKKSSPTDAPHADTRVQQLPRLHQGDAPAVLSLAPRQGTTRPPRPYTEGDLLGAMETAGKDLDDEELRAAMKDSGLGTPATRAAIIEGLLDRRYLSRQRKTLVPTEKGRELIARLPTPVLASAALTGEWEAKLARMAHGAYARPAFMAEITNFTRKTVAAMRDGAGTTPPAPAAVAARSARAHDTPATGSTPPPPRTCDGCGRPSRVVFSRKHARWCFRCDPCGKWISSDHPSRNASSRRARGKARG